MMMDERTSQVPPALDLVSMMEGIIKGLAESNPSLAKAISICAVPRWFDVEVVDGLCPDIGEPALLLQELIELPFCSAYSKRPGTYIFHNDFRSYLLGRPEVVEGRQELYHRAALTFESILVHLGIKGDERFRNNDWRMLAVEWATNQLHADPPAGLLQVRRICAEALAIPVYGPMWEVDFCIQFLNELDWEGERADVTEAIEFLKRGFRAMAQFDNVASLDMAKDLAAVPGLSDEQRAELHYWIGLVQFYEEYLYQPALDELLKASELHPAKAEAFALMAEIYAYPGTTWGRFDLAMQNAQRAVSLAGQDARGYLALGRIATLLEDWPQAEGWFRKAIQVETGNPEGYLALSDVFSSRRDMAQALIQIEAAENANRENPTLGYDCKISKGNVYRSNRRYKEALEQYEAVRKENPYWHDATLALGDLYIELGQSKKAQGYYEQARQLNPSLPETYRALARIAMNDGNHDAAFELCEEGLRKCLQKKSLLFMKGYLARDLGRLDDLAKFQSEVVLLDSAERYASHCALGDSYIELAWRARGKPNQVDHITRARTELEQALQIDPQRAWAYWSLAELRVLCGECLSFEELERQVLENVAWAHVELLVYTARALQRNQEAIQAEQILLRAAELAPHRTVVWSALQDFYKWQGDLPKLQKVINELLKIDPALRYDLECSLGETAQQIGDRVGAKAAYQRAIDLEPESASAYWRLGGLEENEGQSEAAVNHLLKAASLAEDLAPVAHARVAALFRQQGRFVEAEAHARQAIMFGPHILDGYVELATLGIVLPDEQLVSEASSSLGAACPESIYELEIALGNAHARMGAVLKAKRIFFRAKHLQPDRCEANLSLAWMYLGQGDLLKAEKELSEALKIAPQEPDVHAALSQLASLRGNVQQVTEHQEWLIRNEPTQRYDAVLEIGTAYEKNGELVKAGEQARQAIALAPWRMEGYAILAALMRQQATKGEVDEIYQRALTQAGISHLQLATYYLEHDREEDALAIINLAFSLQPDEEGVYLAASRLLEDHGLIGEALKVLKRMARHPKLSYSAWIECGDLRSREEQLPQAIIAFQRAIQIEAKSPEAYLRLAGLYKVQAGAAAMRHQSLQARRKMAACQEVLEQALEAQVQAPEVCDALASVYEEQGQWEKAAEFYLRSAGQQPSAPLASQEYERAGNLWLLTQNYEEARQALQKSLAADPTNAGALYSQGKSYEMEGDLKQAITCYSRAIELDETFGEAYAALCNVYISQNDLAQLSELRKKALELDPQERSMIYEILAAAYQEAGDLQHAEETCRLAIEAEPNRSDAYKRLASILEGLGRLDEAIALNNKVIKSLSDPGEIMEMLVWNAQLLNRQGRYRHAEKVLLKAVKVNPHYALAHYELGRSYELEGRSEQARLAYQRAIQENPMCLQAYPALGGLYGQLGDAAQVERLIGQLLTLAEKDGHLVDGLLLAAKVNEEAGFVSKAAAAYSNAIKTDPLQPEAYLELAQLNASQGWFTKAARVYMEMANQEPLAYQAWFQLGGMYEDIAQYSEAERAYNEAIECDATNSEGYLRLARMLIDQGNTQRGKQVLQRGMDAVHDPADFYRMLGFLYQEEKRWREAIEEYQKALSGSADPHERSELLERMGIILIQQEDHLHAVELLEQAVKEDPNNSGAFYSLGTAYEALNNLNQAEAMYTRSIAGDPQASESIIALLRVYGKRADIVSLSNLLKKAEALDLSDESRYQVHLQASIAYQDARLFELAEHEVKKAIQIFPKEVDAYIQLGWMYEVREQWELAREVYLKLAKVSPEWKPLVYLRSGMLYEREEKLTETEQMYQKAIQLDKTNPDGYAFLGELLTRSGRADEALQVFRRMAKLGGENAAAAYLYQAALHRQLGQVRMFDKDCRQVIALADLERKPSGILLRRAGLAYLMQGDYPAALQRLALAVKRNKQDAQALFYSSLAAAALEDKRKANSFFKRGLKVSKSVQEFKYPIEEAEILVKRNPQLEAVQMLLDNMVAASH